MRYRPYGLAVAGRRAARRNVLNPDGEAREMPAKFATARARRRDPARAAGRRRLRRSLRRAIPSAWPPTSGREDQLDYARREHGVVIDAATLTVDLSATRDLRAAPPG
jgi:hypothetical protein